MFDNPARDAWQKPDEVIRALVLPPDAVVADIGSGTGYFAVRLARAVPQGRVFGVDIEPDMVRYLNERAERESLSNLASYRGDADDPRLPVPVDLAILVAVYHLIGTREQYFRRLRAALKPGGRVAIIDAPRFPPEQVKQELAHAGFELSQEHSFLPDQYFLVFRPAAPK
ncbi:MAG: class I SAM-dependent methyltransferase [Burkholderiales bacterium]